MSASAFQLYEFLLAAGIPGDHARALADALEKRFDQIDERIAAVLDRAAQYTDKAVAVSEEKSKATFVDKDKMAGVATGADADRINVRLDRLETRVGQLEVAMAATHKIAVQTNRLVMVIVVAIIGAVISAGIF